MHAFTDEDLSHLRRVIDQVIIADFWSLFRTKEKPEVRRFFIMCTQIMILSNTLVSCKIKQRLNNTSLYSY